MKSKLSYLYDAFLILFMVVITAYMLVSIWWMLSSLISW